MDNTPDYDNNLAFEPKIPVYPYTWGDLKEYAKRQALFAPHPTRDDFFIGWMLFRYNGEIRVNGIIIAENKTPAQMKTIIEALWG